MVKSYQESEDSRILEAGRAWDLMCQLELMAMQTVLLGPQYSLVLLLGQTPLAPRRAIVVDEYQKGASVLCHGKGRNEGNPQLVLY